MCTYTLRVVVVYNIFDAHIARSGPVDKNFSPKTQIRLAIGGQNQQQTDLIA